MRKLIFIVFLLSICLLTGFANAQPKLTNIDYYINGIPSNQASYSIVTIELKFDTPMDQTIEPTIKYGLVGENYPLSLPASGRWENNILWQGSFAITNNVPSTNDGEYAFKIYGAENETNVAMDTTYSLDLNDNKILIIGRSGELILSADSLFFGNISSGNTKDLQLTLTNNSVVTLEISSLSVESPFYIVNNISNLTIPGKGTYVLTLRFTPLTRAKHIENLVLITNDRRQEVYNVYLSGSAYGARMILSTNGPLEFGKVKPDSSAKRSFRIHNQSAGDPTLSDTLRIFDMATNDPSFSASFEQLNIAPGDTDTVDVTFSPLKYQNYEGYHLTFYSNDDRTPKRTLLLNGDAGDEVPPTSITNLQITWDGFSGSSNTDSLYVCWENPADPSGIAEIWWKFSLLIDPPENQNDTTQYGGRYILESEQNCFYLPLYGKITSGRWYCYLWLVDGFGNSGYLDAIRTNIIYDVTPPGKPIINAWSIPQKTWFGPFHNYVLTIQVPSDPFLRYIDAHEIRWKYKSKPTSATNYSGKSVIHVIEQNQTSFSVPFNSESLCGENDLYIWFSDSVGNSSADSVAMTHYKFDMCAPEITRVPPDSRNIAKIGEIFTDTLQITDHSRVDSAWAKYRFGGAEAEEPIVFLKKLENSDNFLLEIPIAGVTHRGVEYKVFANDSLGYQQTWPNGASSDDWYPIRTRTEGDGFFRIDIDGRPVPLIFGEDETNYQLFSAPYELDHAGIDSVLEDDLAEYDSTVWRFFDLDWDERNTTLWKEGEEARPFAPGRSYFLITRTPDVVVDGGSGQTVKTVDPFYINLRDGWNLIATPFYFPIHKSSLSFINSNYPVSLRSFERGWNITDVMFPWKGYAIYVAKSNNDQTQTIQLKIESKAASGRIAKTTNLPFVLQEEEWLIQVSAESGVMKDKNNWAGFRKNSFDGFDELELAEPPVIGKYVSVYFTHEDWEQSVNHFSTDFRPDGDADHVWEIEVVTNQQNTPVDISFDILGELPKNKEVYLLDEDLGIAKNLRLDTYYSFRSGKDVMKKLLKLAVGSNQFIQEQAETISLIPNEFKLLQNYPNPFNPETSIHFNLPEQAQVKITIYDIQGRKVRTLLDNVQKNAGYHHVVWDATDDVGKKVAAGVYVYNILNGKQILSKKMIYLK